MIAETQADYLAEPVSEEIATMGRAFGDVARLIRDALGKLGDVHPATIAAAQKWIREERAARDLASVVTRTALDWETR